MSSHDVRSWEARDHLRTAEIGRAAAWLPWPSRFDRSHPIPIVPRRIRQIKTCRLFISDGAITGGTVLPGPLLRRSS